MELVSPFVQEVSVDERREALLRASKYALTRGVTTVIDVGRYYPGTTDELSWKDFQGANIENSIIKTGQEAVLVQTHLN